MNITPIRRAISPRKLSSPHAKAAAAAAASSGGISRASFSTSRSVQARNQIHASVRNADQFSTYLLLSSSSRTPLLTLWTTSYCSTCRVVEPLIRSLVESGVGEAEGGVGFCTVEYDAPDVMEAELGLTYMINSIPTLLSFDAQEAQTKTKVADGRQLADRKFLEDWIRTEARRHGDRGGGSGGGSLLDFFGSFFGKSK
ncbi:hypothetical protein B0H63DRAFT_282569 [Podospora didyma]|uniref:Thioredoxin domain-containing protein n=1 Tax=Podospora didyma TaxID=330526 RepID=A0AAE0N6C2_9PEZI|nr:hypothetical protein B0H63DRAFT_282569 [Podospora didyma]